MTKRPKPADDPDFYYPPRMRRLFLAAIRGESERVHRLISKWSGGTSIAPYEAGEGVTGFHVHDWSECRHGHECALETRYSRPARTAELPENDDAAWLDSAERLERIAAELTSLAATARKCADNIQRERKGRK
jgi:hypothetical protein